MRTSRVTAGSALVGFMALQQVSPAGSFAPLSLIASSTVECRACGSIWRSHSAASAGRYSRLTQSSARSTRTSARRGFGSNIVTRMSTDIESPFTTPGINEELKDDEDGVLPLTLENVEIVLDEMRPYLMSDGGNVRVVEIDGPVVKLELEGACGSCPSSTMTMKMGLERRLIQRIPEISEVVQSLPNGPELNEEEIEKVLDGVRPFLSVAGGSIRIESLRGINSIQPVLTLKMTGESASLQSVRMEIMQRVQRNFMLSTLRVEFAP